jgi:hypothetical protein
MLTLTAELVFRRCKATGSTSVLRRFPGKKIPCCLNQDLQNYKIFKIGKLS